MNDEFENFISCIYNISNFWRVSRFKLVFNQPSFKHIYYLLLLYQSLSNFAYNLLWTLWTIKCFYNESWQGFNFIFVHYCGKYATIVWKVTFLFILLCLHAPKYIIKKIIVQVHPKKSTSTQVIIYHNGEKKMVMVVVVFYTPSRPFKNHNSWTKFINCWPFVVHMDIVFKKNVPLILNFYRRI
jgi:hypothetical protein